MGFEPTMSFWPIHTFQACSFDHSDTPLGRLLVGQRYGGPGRWASPGAFTFVAMLHSFWAARRPAWAVGLFLTVLCLALPTRNSTVDAWGYAAEVRWHYELWRPHHLWHNAAGVGWLHLLALLGQHPDPLAALVGLNTLAYGGLLAALGALLRRLGGGAAPVAAWLLAVGSCWALLRFATENETYLLPLLASVLASAAWLRANVAENASAMDPAPPGTTAAKRPNPARGWWLAAGALAALGGLLHQVQSLWWAGLLVGAAWGPGGRWRPGAALWFGVPALLAWPLAYAAALPAWHLPFTVPALLQFALHDYFSGAAGGPRGRYGLLLVGISLVRTLGQVHGYLLPLLQRWPALALLPVLCAGLLAWAGRAWQRARRTGAGDAGSAVALAPTGRAGSGAGAGGWAGTGAAPAVPAAPVRRHLARVHGLIFFVQFGFAAFSDGNAEFMVMLPVLAAVVAETAGPERHWPGAALAAGGTALLAWNLAFGLLPLHLLRLQNLDPWHRLLARQPRARLLLTDPNLLLNQYFYRTGQPLSPPQILPSPAALRRRGPATARALLDSVVRAGHPLCTDLLAPAGPLDRARLVFGPPDTALLRGWHFHVTDSARTLAGWERVWDEL